MNKVKQIFKKAIVENPIFALFLGLCPVLAVSNSFDAAFGMSLAVIVVLIMTNMIISAIRKIVPNEIRIPVYIIIIATVVTVVKMLMSAFMATVFNSLGVYLSLIVVNCIILGRAEAFASKNTVLESFFDALSMGFGFLFAICSIALVREFFGTSGLVFTNPFTGKEIFSFVIAEGKYAIGLLTKPSGAFLIFGLLTAAVNAISISKANKQKEKELAAKKAAAQAK
jgi:electron transport complex protein RnfE